MTALVFWLATAAVVYAYAAYPVVLALAARRRRTPPVEAEAPPPSVSVVIAAFNEAGVIEAKLDSTLRQDYPADRLEAIVVSDGSADGTDAVVDAYGDRRVRLIRQEPRSGKSLALNRGVAAARGDVLVFTDANALFAPSAIRRLAVPFADPRVGLVSGQGLYRANAAADAPAVSNGYVRYEALLKSAEGAFGFVAGADGAIYALRRTLYRDLAPAEVNDLLHPIQTALAGYLCRFEPGACTIEAPSNDARQEFRRHVRIIAQGYYLLSRWAPRLVAARRWRALAFLTAHRLLRWLSGFALAAALVTNVALLDRGGIYVLALGAQLAFYLAALIGLVAERLGVSVGRLAVPYYFCVVSIAGLGGLRRFLRGGAEAVWSPTGQAAPAERAA